MIKRYLYFTFLFLAVGGIIQPFGTNPPSAGAAEQDLVEAPDFVLVTVKAEESIASLAGQYLGSIDKAWQIAEYNGIEKAQPGQRLVIPLRPTRLGGLDPKGYQTIPILHYPRITAGRATPQAVSANDFETQLRYLRDNGYRSVALDQLLAFLNFEDRLPSRTVLITFDSTDRWVYDIAYPVLLRNGFTAAIFVRTDGIGQTGQLSWQELDKLVSAGFDIGTIGHSGKMVASAGVDVDTHLKALEEEIAKPLEAIQTHLKRPCRYFAYSEGRTDDLIISLLKKHGYRAAFTRAEGSNPFFVDNFKIRRSMVTPHQDPLKFREKLTTFRPVDLR